ncbi:MAG: hypothetical protein N2B06_17225 [Clostridium sp.]
MDELLENVLAREKFLERINDSEFDKYPKERIQRILQDYDRISMGIYNRSPIGKILDDPEFEVLERQLMYILMFDQRDVMLEQQNSLNYQYKLIIILYLISGLCHVLNVVL